MVWRFIQWEATFRSQCQARLKYQRRNQFFHQVHDSIIPLRLSADGKLRDPAQA
jgi:hypothetical protein